MKAIKSVSLGSAQVIDNVPLPEVLPEYILVQVTHVAVNPADYLYTDLEMIFHPNATIGCDYCGLVLEVGSAVLKTWKKGDRIAGLTYPGTILAPEAGCFAEVARVKGDMQLKLPQHITDAEAATFGVGISTVGYGFYQKMGIAWPDGTSSDGRLLLIYGGSSATGMLAIQFAKLSGLKVITTCSPNNYGFVKSLGADVVVDYHDPEDCVRQIQEYVGDNLQLVFDCISAFDSSKICAAAMSSKGGIYNTIGMSSIDRPDVENIFTRGQTPLGEAFTFMGQTIPADTAAFEQGKKFLLLAEKLIAEKKIKSAPVEIGDGFEGVLDGMNKLRQWQVSGKKLVYKISAEST